MSQSRELIARLDAAEWELTRATSISERIRDDRRMTTYRRGLAYRQAALGSAALVLLAEWRRLDELDASGPVMAPVAAE